MIFDFPKLVNDFLKYLELEKRDKTTIRNYRFYLKRFWDFFKSTDQKITSQIIQSYQDYLSRIKLSGKKRLSSVTKNYHLIALRNFFKYLNSQGIKILRPEEIKLFRIKTKFISPLKGEEIEKFLSAPLKIEQPEILKFRDKAILELLISTGIKVSQISNLSRPNLNFTFSNQAQCWLKKYLNKRKDLSPILFVRHDRASSKGKPGLTPRSIQRMVKKYAKLAGSSQRISPQTLRHSYALNLISSGQDLKTVQKLLGHKSLSTTKTYHRLYSQHLKDIFRRFKK